MRFALAAVLFGAVLAAAPPAPPPAPPPPPPPPEPPPASSEDDGPSLRRAAEKMREVERLLSEGDSGDRPQVRAAEAVRILEELIRPPPSPPPSGGGGGGGDAKKPPPSGGSKGGGGEPQPEGKGQEKEKKGAGSDAKPSGGGSDSKEKEKEKEKGKGGGDTKPEEKSGGPMEESKIPERKDPSEPSTGAKPPKDRDPWGRLPAKARDEILEIRKEDFPPEYRRLLEEYYKRLSEGE